MASDLSTIIKSEIANTLESLLSATSEVTATNNASKDDMDGQQCILVDVDYEFSKFQTVRWKFFIPTAIATKFEFLMLGGIGDLKDTIDDEISDAVNEIVSNMCGSMSTNINAQDYEDLGGAKFSIAGNEIIQCDDAGSLDAVFTFDLTLDSEEFKLFLGFESVFLPYIALISTGVEGGEADSGAVSMGMSGGVSMNSGMAPASSAILSLLGEDSVDNLKLLFDIKLKLSVRLGSKILLLKDILTWDTGTIIELEQMVNEPLDILVNSVKIGEGEAVIVDGKFGIKIKHIGDRRLG